MDSGLDGSNPTSPETPATEVKTEQDAEMTTNGSEVYDPNSPTNDDEPLPCNGPGRSTLTSRYVKIYGNFISTS